MTQAAMDNDTMVAVTPEWHGPSEHPDHGEPVIAEFHEWDVPTNPAKEHTVWWYEGQWRTYPNTDDRAYVNRWRRIPTRHQSGRTGAGEALREALAEAYHKGASDVHNYWTDHPGEPPRGDPEFGEAASDYADAALDLFDSSALAALSQSTAGEDGA